jgi:FkbM family methyltransferase
VTARRTVIRLLDRPGRRWLLSALATLYARRRTGRNVSVWYDGFWIRSLDSKIHVADSARFDYFSSQLLSFPSLADGMLEASKDYWFHLYEPRAGDVIVDVGAGLGLDTLLFSRAVGGSGRVIAIEAHPDTFRALQKFCQLNRLNNTTCVQVAVVDHERDVYIEAPPGREANTVALAPTARAVIKVDGVSVDEVCRRLRIDRIDLLKMNIEGAERLAIGGMSETIRKTKYVCIACHDFRASKSETYATREAVGDFLLRNGFELVTRQQDSRSSVRDHLHAVNPQI